MATELTDVLSTVEAAAELGITDSLVRRYIRDKDLPAKRLGERSYAIYRRDLERFKRERASNRRAG